MLYRPSQCDFCREEMLSRCKAEHPKWFYIKGFNIKSRHYDKVKKFVDENTPETYCLCFCTIAPMDNIVSLDESYCAKHLRFIAQELDQQSNHLENL